MKKSTTLTRQDAAVEALAALLPSTTAVTWALLDDGESVADKVGEAVVASFVGSTAADMAVVLADSAALAEAAGDESLVSPADVLRPALEAAAQHLGTGVLGDASVDDASSLFSDDETVVYALKAGKAAIGWFAIRVREGGAIWGSATDPQRNVAGKLGRISNVEMALTVEIGRTKMAVRDVLNLEPGAVIELDRSAGAPADILLNGRLIAHGEIVVIDQDYAVRITQILDVAEGVA